MIVINEEIDKLYMKIMHYGSIPQIDLVILIYKFKLCWQINIYCIWLRNNGSYEKESTMNL